MRDDNIWPRASAFEGFRFVNQKDGMLLIRVSNSHFGEQYDTLGEPAPFLLLGLCYRAPPHPCHRSFE